MKVQKFLAVFCLSFAIVACTSDNEILNNQKDPSLAQETPGAVNA